MPTMSPERWQRLASLLDDALDLAPEARDAFLDTACSDDPDLRAEIEALVAADEEAGGFLDDSAAGFAATLLEDLERATAGPQPEFGALIGPYRIVEALGQGGMGTVYLAERADGQFEQRVALKLIRPGMDRREIIRRFLQERQILARLQHPNIARLLDGGVTEPEPGQGQGQPYFAMEFVEGQPITTYCDRHRLTVEDRIRLFLSVAEAVAYAHRNLVIHRDLKPSNILIAEAGAGTLGDGTPRVKLLDFGIAKLLHKDDAEETLIETQMGLRVMTPEYAAPEQARGDAVTTSTDIYALGVVLYELLTGHRPYAFERRSASEMERVICETEPPRPSTIVGQTEEVRRSSGTVETIRPDEVAAARRAPLTVLRRHLAGDLDTVLLKALRKEPHRRYASVEAFIDDVCAHLEGRPVAARKDSPGYRARKFVQRHRVGVATATVALVLLTAGFAVTLSQAQALKREAARTEAVMGFFLDIFEVADPNTTAIDSVTARDIMDRGERLIDRSLAQEPDLQAEFMGVLGDIHAKLGSYDQAQQLYEASLVLRETVYGPNHVLVAASTHALSELALSASDYDEAETLAQRSLAIRRAELGDRDPATAASMAVLAQALHRKGDYDASSRLFADALAITRATLGDEDEQVAAVLTNFAIVRRRQGAHEEAEGLAREALAIRRAVLGEDHVETMTSMNNLAVILRRRDRLDEAEPLFQQVLAFDLERLGEDHINTATVTNNLANVLRDRGRYDEAEPLYRKVLAFDLEELGPEHRYVALVKHNLAFVTRAQGDYDEAERLSRESLALYRRIHGDDHPDVGIGYAAVADVLRDRGDYDGAAPLYEQAVATLRAGPEAPEALATALLGQGRMLDAQGAAREAEAPLRETLRLREAAFGTDHVRTAEARVALGTCLMHLGQTEAARVLLDTGYVTLRARRGDDHRLTRRARTALAELNTLTRS
ncbi:MAG: serine/threonine-protein kinase [Bacteroidota bacterium]